MPVPQGDVGGFPLAAGVRGVVGARGGGKEARRGEQGNNGRPCDSLQLLSLRELS